jgi:hypothetical protein
MAMNLCHRVFCRSGVTSSRRVVEDGMLPWAVLHFRDICNPISPQTLPDRFCKAGFNDVYVDGNARRLRWRAVKVVNER